MHRCTYSIDRGRYHGSEAGLNVCMDMYSFDDTCMYKNIVINQIDILDFNKCKVIVIVCFDQKSKSPFCNCSLHVFLSKFVDGDQRCFGDRLNGES